MTAPSIEQRLDPGPQRPLGDQRRVGNWWVPDGCWMNGPRGLACGQWPLADPWLCPEHRRELQDEEAA